MRRALLGPAALYTGLDRFSRTISRYSWLMVKSCWAITNTLDSDCDKVTERSFTESLEAEDSHKPEVLNGRLESLRQMNAHDSL